MTDAQPQTPLVARSPANNPTPADYPAAHSMDTTWWAVDAHGRVAVLATGESGAAPTPLNSDDCRHDGDELLIQSDLPFACDDLFNTPDGGYFYRDPWADWRQVAWQLPVQSRCAAALGYLLWLRDESALHALQPAAPATSMWAKLVGRFRSPRTSPPRITRLRVADKIVVWLDEVHPAEWTPRIRDWLASGAVCRAWEFQSALDLERFGVYRYVEHNLPCSSGALASTGEPLNPIPVERLPAELRAEAQQYRVAGHSFQRDFLLQPFEWGPADCWPDSWASTTGRIYAKTEHGPGLTPPDNPPCGSLNSGGGARAQLVIDYLRGHPGAGQRVESLFAAAGRDPVLGDTTGRRLNELLLGFLSAEQRWRLEGEAVAELLTRLSPPAAAEDAVRQAILWARNGQPDTITEGDRQDLASYLATFWKPLNETGLRNSPPQQLCWAARALALQYPLIAARTARALDDTQFAFQAEHLLSLVQHDPSEA